MRGFMVDLLTLLSQASLVTLGQDAFGGAGSDVPGGDGPYTVIAQTGGLAGLYQHSEPGPWLERPSAQLSVRARTAELAWAQAQRCYDLLNGLTNRWVGPQFYLYIRASQPPFDMGIDTAGRVKVGFNLRGEARV